MKKALVILAAISLFFLGGIALADDPNGHLGNAKALINQAQAEIDAAIAEPATTVTETVTATVTETVTATPTTPPPSPSPSPTVTSPPPPPPAGFPSRQEALARPDVVVLTGTRTTQYKPAPTVETTFDLRTFTSTAFPTSSSFPVVIEGTRDVVVGGNIIGTQGRDLSWAQVHDVYGGAGLRLFITDYGVSYDLRVENTTDGFDPRPSVGLTGTFLLDGFYMEWIRDDAIEDDVEMSGTIRNGVVNGVNDAISIGQSTKNPNAVVNVENVTFIHAPMRNDRAADGFGHQTLFKQAPGGRVNLTNVTDCLYENPITPSRIGIRPPGTWTNVVFVLGPGWVGADPTVPSGATVSRNWSGLCTA